jgi:tRNA modification GTPase
MLNAAEGVTAEDLEIIRSVRHKKLITLINKTDISLLNPADEKMLDTLLGEVEPESRTVISTSLLDATGVEALEDAIAEMFSAGFLASNSEILVTNIRHKNLMDNAIKSIDDGLTAYESGMPLDCLSIDIRNAADNLGLITGESVQEDVLHSIFSRFCIGK